MTHILMIEDDAELGYRLKRNLEFSGYKVTLTGDGHSGLVAAENPGIHLILLDLMLPFIDGLRILQKIRKKGICIPVIIISALDSEEIKLDGFDEGCDDYLTKPFSFKELIARIRAVLRRSGHGEKPQALHIDELILDPVGRRVIQKDKNIEFTPKEFELFFTLAGHVNQALHRSFLIETIWGKEAEIDERTLDAHIFQIRKKLTLLGDVHVSIETVYKVGYRCKTDKLS